MRMDFSTFHRSLEPSFEERGGERRGGCREALKEERRDNAAFEDGRLEIFRLTRFLPARFNIAGLFRCINARNSPLRETRSARKRG